MKSGNTKINREIEAIKSALKQFSEGASREELQRVLDFDIELRTIQRRLRKLVGDGVIIVSGNTRSIRYHLIDTGNNSQENAAVINAAIPLTKEAKAFLASVTRPIQQRHPVGYNALFLQRYQPNQDSYLTREEIRKLEEIGKTARTDQPAGTYAQEILNRLLIDLSWNSSRLEGNTYTLLDTEQLISHGEMAENKSAMDAQMILNHKDAIEFMVQSAPDIGYNRYTILNLHALLSNNLLPDPAASGRLRSFGVGIARSAYMPLAIPQQIEAMFDLMLQKAEQIENPFEQAFFIMVQLPYLQPFDDVNKRVSRLAANIPFNRHNLSPLAFVDVPDDLYIGGMLGVYELNRVELLKDVFMWAYERSAARYAVLRQSIGEPDPFRLKYRDRMREVITHIISNALPRRAASLKIAKEAHTLPSQDLERFIEIVETELLSLHEGNFARYRVTPSEFRQWKAAWENK